MLDYLCILLVCWVGCVHCYGSRCKDLKQAYPEYQIKGKPLFSSNGTCSLDRTCCTGEVETRVKEDAMKQLRQVVSSEVSQVHGTLGQITDMTAVQLKTMINELVPAEVASLIDIDTIGDLIWAYTIGNITSYELTVEVAVIGSDILFTDKASQKLRDMTECIIRELGSVATEAFQQIAEIVEGVLEAPRTFGKGFEVVGTFLNSVERFEIPQNCDFDELFGCPRCGVKVPEPCYSTCLTSANSCLENVVEMKPLWSMWVDSIAALTDAMVLMKDIQMDPNELVTPELVQELTDSITGSMFSADFAKCRKRKKRLVRSVRETTGVLARPERQISEGETMKLLLSGHFSSLTGAACRRSVYGDKECWLGNRVGDYNASDVKPITELSRETKSYGDNSLAAAAINGYKDLVDDVIDKIHAKVRASRDSPPPSEYSMWSRGNSIYLGGDARYLIISLVLVILTLHSIINQIIR